MGGFFCLFTYHQRGTFFPLASGSTIDFFFFFFLLNGLSSFLL